MNNSEEGGVSDGALSGMVILGLIATLMALTVIFMVVYIRYTPFRRLLQNQERIRLIPDDE